MAERTLPPWDRDPLSTFLSEAERNERVSSLKLPDVYGLLQRVHSAFQSLAAITEKDHHAELLPTRFLMARTHAAFLAAIRLGMSGQVVEAYPALRAVIEDAWYALHLAKDPNPPSRARTWLCRNDDQAAKAQCKAEFTVANVRATHAALDPATANALQTLYEWTIELGAHPNEQGILAAMSRTDTDQSRTYGVAILADDPTLVVTTLKIAVDVAVGALKTFRLIFPERFTIMGFDAPQLREAEATARALGVRLQALEARVPQEIDSAFAAMTRERTGALVVLVDAIFTNQVTQIAELAAKRRLPSIYGQREYAEAGGLMVYSSNPLDLERRAAVYVDRILKGAKPGDLPVEQPTKFELVINLKTAKALGLTIPQSVLFRADEVIQ